MPTYAIFQVYDYKGGELSSSVNLSFYDFISNLCEKFHDIKLDTKSEIRDKKINSVVDNNEAVICTIKPQVMKKLRGDFYSTYGTYEAFCGKLYEIDNNKMKKVLFEDYVDDIVKHIKENW